LLDSIFRSVHTFKAAAAAEGRNHASSLAHNFEDLLQELRIGKRKLDDEVLRVFEDTTAGLLSESAVSPLIGFTQFTGDENIELGQLPAEFSHLNDEERHRALSAVQEGSNLYTMEVVFAAIDFDERYRQLKSELQKTSELISSSAAMQDDEIVFKVVYASKSEKIPIQIVLRQAIRAGNSAAAALSKQVSFVAEGEELLVERRWADVLTDALSHLLRNAVAHGIESHGTVLVKIEPTQITVTDDGRGIDPANLGRLFEPGFSTASEITEVSGRGVGLDAVKSAVEELGGSVEVASELQKGSSFKIKFPNQYPNEY
jgi:two-component system chemotaxis sensor kinase CheA